MKSLKPVWLTLIAVVTFFMGMQTSAAQASDVDSSHPNYEAIMYLMDKGIVNGYSDGTIRPDQEITRAELLKIFVKSAAGRPETFEYNRCFDDVEILEWYTGYVCYAKAEGWVEGYEDGSFKPANSIDNLESLAMLFRTQGLNMPEYWEIDSDPFTDVSLENWYGPSVWYAKENGIIDGDSANFYPGTLITRGEAFEMLYRTLLYKKELLKPVLYSDENVSFTHSGFYTQEIDTFTEDDTMESFSDMITLFTNDNNDGIAFMDEEFLATLEEETGLNIDDLLTEMTNGVYAEDVKVKSGKVSVLSEYNEFFEDFDDGAGTFLFKVDPAFGSNSGVYVIAHYSDAKTREELIAMFKTIVIK
ncbi:hypothetical protein C0416_02240 [bacterium]|nr:hypothetical protein [bacterium]